VAAAGAPFETAQRRLLAPAGFRPADYNLLVNFRAEIPHTLPAVETLLRRPQTVDSLVPAFRKAAGSSEGIAASLWPWLGIVAPRVPALVKVSARAAGLRTRILAAEGALQASLASLSPEETLWLRETVPGLMRMSTEDTALDPVATEIARQRSDAEIDSVILLANRVRLDQIARASVELERVRETILASAYQAGIPGVLRLLRALQAAGIPVALGSYGNDAHRLDHGIVVDPAGDDRYTFSDTARPGSWLLVIDLGGNDVYQAHDSSGGAAAFLSAQILDDEFGNDRYEGLDFAFGSALLGYAHLVDASGNDVYAARCASLGFAFYGLGLLEDREGNDTYSTAYLSQGAASAHGLGLLRDDAGNDRYESRPVYPDDLRYRDHFLSMSQGFSTGFAPRHAGGIGALWDRTGHDVYRADIFGQGTGYWFAWGLMMDDTGNDTVQAYQYAQGAGVHFAAGTLWDREGDDVRLSKGVSQGCGHDGGFGLLVDERGNDRDTATDMSVGAGSANGLGIYFDAAGDDRYPVGNPHMTMGHGDMRRDRGSFGAFLDLGGQDEYPAGAGPRENAAWRVYDGKTKGYGVGLDAD
jgi:hypothetical protein